MDIVSTNPLEQILEQILLSNEKIKNWHIQNKDTFHSHDVEQKNSRMAGHVGSHL